MRQWFIKMIKGPTLRERNERDLEMAREGLRQHTLKAEYHDAMCMMYSSQVDRLEEELVDQPIDLNMKEAKDVIQQSMR